MAVEFVLIKALFEGSRGRNSSDSPFKFNENFDISKMFNLD